MKKIIILNGPNLNLLGEREKDQYGNVTLRDIENNCIEYALKNEIKLSFYQSNIEGELVNQIQKSRNFNITEEEYITLITKKTASLFSCCCLLGLISSGNEKTKNVENFGLYLGIIFQIKDDLSDYSKKRIGKPTKDDLESQKITLPLIYSIKNASQVDRRSIRSILKRKKLSNQDKKLINKFVEENNGFKYAENVMLEYKNKALKILETFPVNESKNSLKILLDYIIERKY